MCVIPLGPSLQEDTHGVLIDAVVAEHPEAGQLLLAGDATGAMQALRKASSQLREKAEALLKKAAAAETAATLIDLRTTNDGRLATD
jgi:hypothetical protein